MDAMNGSDTMEVDEASQATTSASSKPHSAKRKPVKPAKRQIVQSTIGFPYRDLESAISVARQIIGSGAGALTTDQLAGVMGLQMGSGNFVIKVGTARMFGLISNSGGRYELTTLGFNIVDSDEKKQRAARAEAFLCVPLYRRVYEEFKGKQLPPRPKGLEQAFVRFGVSEKQKYNARLAFDKSAGQAGFFSAGNDRLIEPIIAGGPPLPNRPPIQDDNGGGNGGSKRLVEDGDASNVSGFHPFVQGLLDTLPEPNTNWAIEGRAKWLQTAANIFDLIYKGSGEISVISKVVPAKE